MSAKTPRVTQRVLYEPLTDVAIALDTPDWYAWLADEHHRCFHFDDPTGGFTARKERKQRGQWYWVAYRQVHCKLYKVYLGKTETLSADRLTSATHELAQLAPVEATTPGP